MGAERGAAHESVVADASEAIGQAGQREGGASVKGVGADAGEAVGQAGQREGGAAVEALRYYRLSRRRRGQCW